MRATMGSLVMFIFLLPITASAQTGVVGWRLNGTGQYPDAAPPTEWAQNKNVVWATPMPDWSNASPILVNGRLFVQSEPTNLICVGAARGNIIWTRSNAYPEVMTPEDKAEAERDKVEAGEVRKEMAPIEKRLKDAAAELQKLTPASTTPPPPPPPPELKAKQDALKKEIENLNKQLGQLKAKLAAFTKWENPPANETNGYSSPTPVSDGKLVYALFGNGVAACYDLEGNRKWIRIVARSTIEDGLSTSPVLADGKLLVHPDALTALDQATGRTLWRTEDTEPCYGTPFVTRLNGTTVAVTPNGDVVRMSDGKILARKISNVSYCSPVVDGGIAYFVQNTSKAHGGGHAVRLSAQADGALKTEVLWQTKPAKDRYYASPLITGGLIYAVTQAKVFSVINAADGQVVKQIPLILGKGTTFPSICMAGGLLFVSHDSGDTAVIRPGRDAEVIRVNSLEPFRTTPLFVGKRIYVRGMKSLYCIGRGD